MHFKNKIVIKRQLKIKKPFFSIITVVKNSENLIEKTIKSVLSQKFKNFEYLVIDGQSNDGTIKKIFKYKKYINTIISEKDENLWHAMNKGIQLSKGHVIAFLNAGDVYYSNALNIVNKYFKNYKIDFLFTSVKKKKVYHGYYPEKIYYRFNIYPSHSCGFFIKKSSQLQIGYYDTKLKYGSDLDLFYKLIKFSNLLGMSSKSGEITGKFDLNGMSNKLPFYKKYFYESLVRYKNKQNIIYIIILYVANFFNYFRNIIKK